MASLSMALAAGTTAAAPLEPIVEIEEDVYSYTPANNGAGPMWTHGNTCIVRVGEELLASGLETLADYKPLNNVRWLLFRRGPEGWALATRGEGTHEREPCPLVVYPGGPVLLSTNPNTCNPDQYDGPATPQVLEFPLADCSKPTRTLIPAWDREIQFHGHTYRSFAADGPRRESLLIYNTAYDRAYWTFLDAEGRWAHQGAVDFPFGKEYDEPQPIRICYPAVALKDRAVHFCGVSDIIGPYKAWREFKQELTGQKWDYDFRRLFYTWCDDVAAGGRFHEWIEVASRDQTCGWIFPCDLHVGAAGRVYLLWTERALDERLRPKFFPEAKQSVALNCAVLERGAVVQRIAIQEWHEDGPSAERPGAGRFQVLPDGRLLVVYYVSGTDAEGKAVSENRLVEVRPDGSLGVPVTVPLQKPMSSFFTATPRAGCAPSATLDLFADVGQTLRYARVRIASGASAAAPSGSTQALPGERQAGPLEIKATQPALGAAYPAGTLRIAYTSGVDGLEDWALFLPGDPQQNTVVYLHGSFASADQIFTRADVRDFWLTRIVQGRHPLLSVNLRGTAYMSPAASTDLTALLGYARETLGCQRFVLLGGSGGASSAMAYAVLHPEQVHGVIAMGMCDILPRLAFARASDNPVLRDLARTVFAAYGGTPEELPEVYAARSVLAHAERLTMPIVLTMGENDALIPVAETRKVAAALKSNPRFVYHEVPNGNHDAALWVDVDLATLRVRSAEDKAAEAGP